MRGPDPDNPKWLREWYLKEGCEGAESLEKHLEHGDQLEWDIPYELDDEGKTVRGPNNNPLRHGLARQYWPDGKLKLERPYLSGHAHGDEILYRRDGETIWHVLPFVHGKRHGIYRVFYPDGRLETQREYVEDREVVEKRDT